MLGLSDITPEVNGEPGPKHPAATFGDILLGILIIVLSTTENYFYYASHSNPCYESIPLIGWIVSHDCMGCSKTSTRA
ncbi:hypothetical protein H9L39_00828 [Fusarium oxysporum f. sp. albedinis]|nr:hypothetical protein H9L39_00828 [Fusarium oxysporum f. sp. albedinis]